MINYFKWVLLKTKCQISDVLLDCNWWTKFFRANVADLVWAIIIVVVVVVAAEQPSVDDQLFQMSVTQDQVSD